MSENHSTQTSVRYKSLGFLGFPNYRVGDDGTVWSKGRSGANGPRGIWNKLKATPGKWGHLLVILRANGKVKGLSIHRLVLLAFVGSCPEGMECRHFPDRDPSNNRLENLQWGTGKEQYQDKLVHGTDNKGNRNGGSKLTLDEVEAIRELWAVGNHTQKETARLFGMNKTTIFDIIHKLSWKGLLV